MVDQNKRREIIKYDSEKLAKEKGGNILVDEDLLDEVTYIVEYPTPIIGRIKEEYLRLTQRCSYYSYEGTSKIFPSSK